MPDLYFGDHLDPKFIAKLISSTVYFFIIHSSYSVNTARWLALKHDINTDWQRRSYLMCWVVWGAMKMPLYWMQCRFVSRSSFLNILHFFLGFARTLMLHISFLQNFAKKGRRLSYKAVLLDIATLSPIHVLLLA